MCIYRVCLEYTLSSQLLTLATSTPIDPNEISLGTFKLYVKKVWNKTVTNPLNQTHLLLNTGGPAIASASDSSSGVEAFADMLYALTSPDYVLVGVDPRASGKSGLKVMCNTSDHNPGTYFPDAPPSLDDNTIPLLRTQLHDYFDAERAYIKTCADNTPHLAYIGTYYTADDMIYAYDKIVAEADTPVDFFGESYGSFLGLGMAVKYPQRVGKFFLNGIMSPAIRANTGALTAIPSYLRSADSVFEKMVGSCQQAESCPYQNITERLIDSLTAMVYNNTDPAIRSMYTSRTRAVDDVYQASYAPTAWKTAFRTIKQATSLIDIPSSFGADSNISSSRGDALNAINCADAQMEEFTVDEAIDAFIGTYDSVTQRFYSQYLYQSGFLCQLYPSGVFDRPRLTEFSGVDFANKLLLASNAYDPILPLEQAQEAQEVVGKNNAAVLTIKNGYGHTSTPNAVIPDTSGCVEKHSKAFFNGKKPNDCSCTVNDAYYIDVYD